MLTRIARHAVAFAVTVTAALALSASCSVPAATLTDSGINATIGGAVTGLKGGGLVLQNLGHDDLPLASDGHFSFPTTIATGGVYDVTVKTQPANPGQTCTVTGGSGVVGGADVTTVAVTCTSNPHKVGGMVTGLAGAGLILQNNGGDDLAISANGAFTFATAIASGAAYAVTVKTQPSGPAQTCSLVGDTGTVADADVTTVTVTCQTAVFTVGGTVAGLTGGGLVLRNNNGDDLAITGDGSFTFNTPIASGAAYAVTVSTQPSGPSQICNVTSGTGTMGAAAITSVGITCTTRTFTIGGTVSGLTGTGLVLKDNGGDNLPINMNGGFTFATAVASGGAYAVTVGTQPSGPSQTCAVTSDTGTVGSANVTGVTVTCTVNHFTVGGTVTGLTGGGLVLRNNGLDDLPISASGAFTFATPVASGAAYAVTVAASPTGPSQTCLVTAGGGTVTSGPITSVVINCTTNSYTVGGLVQGLVGTGLLIGNGADTKVISANGAFTLPTAVASGAMYTVTVQNQPTGPTQTCGVANGMGTIAGANVSNIIITCTTSSFTIGGNVVGLSGAGLVLRDNGGDDLPISATGAFTFHTAVASGAAYAVTVAAQPSAPTQVCTVTGGSGSVGGANVTNVQITCVTSTFTLGGTVSGLLGAGLTLANSDGQTVTIVANGAFTFATKIASGATYQVTVMTQPSAPTQTCNVSAGMGTVGAGNVTGVSVNCAANTYTVGGTVSGLVGKNLILQNNAGDNLTLSANGAFAFPSAIASGQPYAVTVFTQPTAPTQTCSVAAGAGTVGSANVTTVSITCATATYTISGTISGLSGSMVLQDNGGDNLPVSANGAFTFATKIASGATYAVTVFTQPAAPSQTCVVTGGTGTVVASNVTNVTIACTTNNYSIGGTVSGLAGAGLKLTNGAETLTISANGGFTFTTKVVSGLTYAVTATGQPTAPTQACVVTSGSGTVGAADVTNVMVTCTTSKFLIGGTISGLVGSVTLLDVAGTNTDNLIVSANGAFLFAVAVASGTVYTVSVGTQPTSPAQTCVVTAATGTGTVGGANVTTVAVSCTTNSYQVSATVSGLAGTGLKLLDNGGDSLPVNANGTFAFATKVASGQLYAVTVASQPTSPTQTCVVTGGAGTIAATAVVATVTCTTNAYTVGGTVTNLTGTGLVLQDSYNATNANLTVNASGGFTFPTPVPSGSVYTVNVLTQPTGPAQFCTVTAGGTGTIGGANVTTVTVNCAAVCGNGVVEAGEQCDDGNTINTDACTNVCRSATCGDGFVYLAGGETCDDGNTANGDGCSATCKIEGPYAVGGTIQGLSAAGLILQNNAGDNLSLAAGATSFTFATPLAFGASYNVTVAAQPAGLQCAALANTGVVTAPVTSVVIKCGHTMIATGGNHACGIAWDSSIECWGIGTNGELGDGLGATRGTPAPVSAPAGKATGWTSITAGGDHTCALRTDGGLSSMWCWGYNFSGQLGDGTTTTRLVPTLAGSQAWTQVRLSPSSYGTCAIRSDQTGWCWGAYASGPSSSSTPLEIIVGAKWSQLAVGNSHACGVKTDGTLWCWGKNVSGELGTGPATVDGGLLWQGPKQVGTLTTWLEVAGSDAFTCGRQSPGTLWCWGRNSSGQLGDGTTTPHNTPTQVGAQKWGAVTLGATHACGQQSGGLIQCWGANAVGQLGDGTTTAHLAPAPIPGVWVSVSAGGYFTCATAVTGQPSCWGQNTNGQLGDGTTNGSTSPGVVNGF
jgi:cysteine-rich repeat protein